MSPIERAQELLEINPLPSDIEAQLTALEAEATGEEKAQFAWIWEGLARLLPPTAS